MTIMTSQHTPGPWEVKPLPKRDAIIMHGPHIVARCERKGIESFSSGFADATVEANARLIAAAPEMLTEIKELLAHAEYADGQATVLTQDCEALEALLAKIEGR